MKINKKQKRIYIYVLIAVLVALLVGASIWWFLSTHVADRSPVDPPTPTKNDGYISNEASTPEQEMTGVDIKNQSLNPTTDDNQTDTSTLSGQVTSKNIHGDTLSIRTLFNTVTSSASCALDMRGPNDKSYSTRSDAQPMSSYTTCRGFDIPLSELSPGDWTATIKFTGDQQQAVVTERITIP